MPNVGSLDLPPVGLVCGRVNVIVDGHQSEQFDWVIAAVIKPSLASRPLAGSGVTPVRGQFTAHLQFKSLLAEDEETGVPNIRMTGEAHCTPSDIRAIYPSSRMTQNGMNHLAPVDRRPLITAVVRVRQLQVIQAETMQDRGVDVV